MLNAIKNRLCFIKIHYQVFQVAQQAHFFRQLQLLRQAQLIHRRLFRLFLYKILVEIDNLLKNFYKNVLNYKNI